MISGSILYFEAHLKKYDMYHLLSYAHNHFFNKETFSTFTCLDVDGTPEVCNGNECIL